MQGSIDVNGSHKNSRALRVILPALWILSMAGIYLNIHEWIWQVFRSVGLTGHVIGLVFIWIPITIFLLEWIIVIALPVWLLWNLFRTPRVR